PCLLDRLVEELLVALNDVVGRHPADPSRGLRNGDLWVYRAKFRGWTHEDLACAKADHGCCGLRLPGHKRPVVASAAVVTADAGDSLRSHPVTARRTHQQRQAL